MEPNQNTSKKNNNLWVGELDQSMDETYLKEACQKYSKQINLMKIIIFLNKRHRSKKC
jgi:hypothetical protein